MQQQCSKYLKIYMSPHPFVFLSHVSLCCLWKSNQTVALLSDLPNPTFYGTAEFIWSVRNFPTSASAMNVSLLFICTRQKWHGKHTASMSVCAIYYLHLCYIIVPVFKINWLLLVTCYLLRLPYLFPHTSIFKLCNNNDI
jgi:hypothetical protein